MPAIDRLCEFLQSFARVGHERQRAMLAGIERLHVEPDDLLASLLEQRPRAGCEILQPCADSQYDIRLFRQPVGGRCTGDADRRHVERMVVRQRGLAALRLADRNTGRFHDFGESGRCLRIEDAAACNDERLFSPFQSCRSRLQLGEIRSRTALHPQTLLEEALRKVVGLGLDILAQAPALPARIRPGLSERPSCATAPE